MVARRGAKITPMPTQTILEDLLTFEDVQKVLKIGRDEVLRLVKEEGLPVVSFGPNRRRVIPSSLAIWVKKREESHGA